MGSQSPTMHLPNFFARGPAHQFETECFSLIHTPWPRGRSLGTSNKVGAGSVCLQLFFAFCLFQITPAIHLLNPANLTGHRSRGRPSKQQVHLFSKLPIIMQFSGGSSVHLISSRHPGSLQQCRGCTALTSRYGSRDHIATC